MRFLDDTCVPAPVNFTTNASCPPVPVESVAPPKLMLFEKVPATRTFPHVPPPVQFTSLVHAVPLLLPPPQVLSTTIPVPWPSPVQPNRFAHTKPPVHDA